MFQLQTYWRILVNGWWLILITTALAVILAVVITESQPRIYQSQARYIVSPNYDAFAEETDFVRRSIETIGNSNVLPTYVEVFDSPRIYQEALDDLGLTGDDVQGYQVTAVNLPQTNIIQVSVRGETPSKAMELANAIGAASSDYLRNLYTIYDVQPLENASVPHTPINESSVRSAGVAGILGFAVGLGLAFLYTFVRHQELFVGNTTRAANPAA